MSGLAREVRSRVCSRSRISAPPGLLLTRNGNWVAAPGPIVRAFPLAALSQSASLLASTARFLRGLNNTTRIDSAPWQRSGRPCDALAVRGGCAEAGNSRDRLPEQRLP